MAISGWGVFLIILVLVIIGGGGGYILYISYMPLDTILTMR